MTAKIVQIEPENRNRSETSAASDYEIVTMFDGGLPADVHGERRSLEAGWYTAELQAFGSGPVSAEVQIAASIDGVIFSPHSQTIAASAETVATGTAFFWVGARPWYRAEVLAVSGEVERIKILLCRARAS